MKINYLFSLFIVMSALISCQRVIDVDISSTAQQLVIEGNLTDRPGTQTVTISRSVAYNSANVFPAVSGASVVVNDAAGTAYKFTETQPGTYTLKNFRSKALTLYVLTVKVEGKTYYATSAMPLAVNLDSLTLVSQIFGNKNIRTVVVNYQDPAFIANQYRFVMYVNGVQVKRVFTENDQLGDGSAITSMLYQQDIELQSGDKVDVDMECIDADIYNYWNSLSNQGGNTPQTSATPSNPPSNISNGALGYFSAHTIQRKTIIIP